MFGTIVLAGCFEALERPVVHRHQQWSALASALSYFDRRSL